MIISDFCGFLNFFLDFDQEIMDFYKYLDRDFSSQPYLFRFCASKLASKWSKSVGNSKNLDYLEKAWLSWFILMVSISLHDLDKNLDTAKSRLKISTRKKKFWSQHDG